MTPQQRWINGLADEAVAIANSYSCIGTKIGIDRGIAKATAGQLESDRQAVRAELRTRGYFV